MRFYKEIPFLDAPEGVYFDSVTHTKGFISADAWAKRRALMVMIDPDGVEAIKLQWYESCRQAGLLQQQCNVAVNSVMDTIFQLDQVAKAVLKP